MPRYRLFEQDPITNLWRDKGWVEGDSQTAALKGTPIGIWHFVVPESSFHPARRRTEEVPRWDNANGNDWEPTPDAAAEVSAAVEDT